MTVKLRAGVYVSKGQIQMGSPYYLVDEVQEKEWHISQRMAAYLTNNQRAWTSATEKQIERFKGFLDDNKLTVGSIIEKPKAKIRQQVLSQSLKVLDPHDFLKARERLWSWIFSKKGGGLFIALTLIATYLLAGSYAQLINHFDSYNDSSFHIMIALVLVKAAHELGHSMAIIKYKGTVSGIKVVMIAGMPLPKNDAFHIHKTSFNQRMVIGGAGVYIEAYLAVIAAILWIFMEDSGFRTALHFVAVISLPLTIAINMVPLMKFDGYYILSNALRSPRLYEDAVDTFRNTVYSSLGISTQPVSTTSIPSWKAKHSKNLIYNVYGAGILVWKILLPFGIALGVTTLIDARIAYLIAVIPFVTMWLDPLVNETTRLKREFSQSQPTMKHYINRAITSAVVIAAAVYVVVPMSHIEEFQGAVLRDTQVIKSTVDGIMVEQSPSGPSEQGEKLVKVKPIGTQQQLVQADMYLQQAYSLDFDSEANINETQYLQARSQQAIKAATTEVEKGEVQAGSPGIWEPRPFKAVVKSGDVLGVYHLNKAKVSAFVPVQKKLPKRLSASIILPSGRVVEKEIDYVATITDTSKLPSWLPISESEEAFFVYEAELAETLISAPVKVIVRRNYSIAREGVMRSKSNWTWIKNSIPFL